MFQFRAVESVFTACKSSVHTPDVRRVLFEEASHFLLFDAIKIYFMFQVDPGESAMLHGLNKMHQLKQSPGYDSYRLLRGRWWSGQGRIELVPARPSHHLAKRRHYALACPTSLYLSIIILPSNLTTRRPATIAMLHVLD